MSHHIWLFFTLLHIFSYIVLLFFSFGFSHYVTFIIEKSKEVGALVQEGM